MKNALLGPWDATFNKNGTKAKYTISKDNESDERIKINSCNWKGCDKTRSALLKPSDDTRYPLSDGWFKAKSLHKPEEDLFVKNEGESTKLVEKNRVTNETIEGEAAKNIAGKKNFYHYPSTYSLMVSILNLNFEFFRMC